MGIFLKYNIRAIIELRAGIVDIVSEISPKYASNVNQALFYNIILIRYNM